MTKHRILVLLTVAGLLCGPALLGAQVPPPHNAEVTYFAGDPSGACSNGRLWWNTTSEHLWICESGGWVDTLAAVPSSSPFDTPPYYLNGYSDTPAGFTVEPLDAIPVRLATCNSRDGSSFGNYVGGTAPTACPFNGSPTVFSNSLNTSTFEMQPNQLTLRSYGLAAGNSDGIDNNQNAQVDEAAEGQRTEVQLLLDGQSSGSASYFNHQHFVGGGSTWDHGAGWQTATTSGGGLPWLGRWTGFSAGYAQSTSTNRYALFAGTIDTISFGAGFEWYSTSAPTVYHRGSADATRAELRGALSATTFGRVEARYSDYSAAVQSVDPGGSREVRATATDVTTSVDGNAREVVADEFTRDVHNRNWAGVYHSASSGLQVEDSTSPGTGKAGAGFFVCNDTAGGATAWRPEYGVTKDGSTACDSGVASSTLTAQSGGAVVDQTVLNSGGTAGVSVSSVAYSTPEWSVNAFGAVAQAQMGVASTGVIRLDAPAAQRRHKDSFLSIATGAATPVLSMEGNATSLTAGATFTYYVVQDGGGDASRLHQAYSLICRGSGFTACQFAATPIFTHLYESNAGDTDLACTPTVAFVNANADIELRLNCNNVNAANSLVMASIDGVLYNTGSWHEGAATP